MNNLFLYLFESGISLTLLYSIYWLFLKKDTFFNRNRIFLAVSILFSMIIPLINIQLAPGTDSFAQFIQLDEVLISPEMSRSFTSILLAKSVSLLLVIYLLGFSFFSGILIFRLYQIWNWIQKGESSSIGKIKIIRVRQNISPFSFFNWVFLPENHSAELENEEIINHEKVHIQQVHTLDLLVSELLIVFQWFNPIVWLYRFSFKEIHEYTADSLVLKKGTNLNNYQNLIMNQIFGIQFFPVGNNFNKSLIKKRIIMMTKSKSSKAANIKLLFMVPAILLLVLNFSCSSSDDNMEVSGQETIPQAAIENDIPDVEVAEEIFFIVEEMPEFEGDDKGEKFREYIGENLIYPEKAAQNKISGRVFVQFIVKSDGTVANVKVVRGVDPLLDAEAIRVIESSPKWEPGKQRGKAVNLAYTFPINFVLQ